MNQGRNYLPTGALEIMASDLDLPVQDIQARKLPPATWQAAGALEVSLPGEDFIVLSVAGLLNAIRTRQAEAEQIIDVVFHGGVVQIPPASNVQNLVAEAQTLSPGSDDRRLVDLHLRTFAASAVLAGLTHADISLNTTTTFRQLEADLEARGIYNATNGGVDADAMSQISAALLRPDEQ